MDLKSLLQKLSIAAGSTVLSAIGASLLPGLTNENIDKTLTYSYAAIGILLLLWGFGVVEKVIQFSKIWFRDNKIFSPKIGILYGTSRGCNSDIPRVYSALPPEGWGVLIQNAAKDIGEQVSYELIPATSSFDGFNVILNPYGSNYPEISFDEFPTYKKILNYMKHGGLFVNVADIPTYWAFNPKLKRMLDRTPALYSGTGEEVRYFQRVPFMQELALRVQNVENVPPTGGWPFIMKKQYSHCKCDLTEIKQSRAVIVEGNIESVVVPRKIGTHDMTPLFFCNYGNGRCLISLSFLDGQFEENYQVTETIAKLVVDQLFNKKAT